MADTSQRPTTPSPFDAFERRIGELFHLESTTERLDLTRGGPAIQLDVAPDRHPVVLVEDPVTGVLSWAWPDQRTTRGAAATGTTFVLAGAADRGIVSMVGKKIIRVLTPKIVDAALEAAGERLVARWESSHRPEALVRFDALSVDLPPGDPGVAAGREAFGDDDTGDEPALLLVHGLAARTRSGFQGLRGRGMSRLSTRYGSRIVGFDHPSLATSPLDNAASLARRLTALHAEARLPTIDIIGHGRGGLVARALLLDLAELGIDIDVGRVWCVGTPNQGQPLASPEQLRTYVDRLTNLVGWLPLGGVEDIVDGVLTTVAHLALGALGGLEGITGMAPGSPVLATLNAPTALASWSPHLFAVASNYVPRPGAPLADRAKALAAGQLLRGPNDLLTTVESTFGSAATPVVPLGHQRLFGDAHGINHANYFDHPATVDFVVDPEETARGAVPVTRETWRPTIHDEDGTIVGISVSHCSLEESQYAVMVGTYANESLAGAERFLDSQLRGELMARFQIDRYPADVGTSLFLPADDDGVRTSNPPGAYVVGLGSTILLGRPELARSVRQAIVDRCLRLYQGGPANEAGAAPPSGIIEVGVSSTLLGVRNNDGLSVTESVAGIVDGVLEANRALVRYEATRSDAPTPVRVTALEIVERYADRADRAVLAVRSLSSLVRLGPGYDELLHLTVDSSKRGGLPAGSAVNDHPQDWQRFVITGRGPLPDLTGGPRSMQLEITALGSDARADRVSHELDVAVVDSLVERLGRNRADEVASSTLFNFLVPDEIRPKFQTASAVQFVVDGHTANFPWELLSAPRAGQLRRLAESTSVVRQFTESEDRRLAPVRATASTALVIAAGNLTDLAKLPGVYREAGIVAEALRSNGTLTVKVLDDEDAPFDTASLMIETFGAHKLLHIASHGEYVENDPARTGAMLSDELILTANKIRLLPQVPDLVFLNCCNLAQVGSHRMAAGLARELMAIGVRAVIAAGWPVGDAAAVAFAETFYEHYLDGTTFGEAVARARLACALAGGAETWAAYQCYGDPTLLFSGNSAAVSGDDIDPASVDDLVRRLRALEVRVSDLGRPGETDLVGRRAALRATLQQLTTWADANGASNVATVSRQMAVVARQLGDFQEAADRLMRMIDLGPERPVSADRVRLRGKDASAFDLQQAANTLARAAHARHRFALATATLPDGPPTTPADDLALATAMAGAACRIVGDRESYGILGGVLRRRAIVDRDGRQAHLDAAFEAYFAAAMDAATVGDDGAPVPRPGEYGYENARQFAALLGLELPDNPVRPPVRSEAPRRVDERRSLAADFWECTNLGDELLTELLRSADAGSALRRADRVLAAYEAAFQTRSSFADRNTSFDQIDCLLELARGEERLERFVAPLESITRGLARWEADNLAAEPPGAPPDVGDQPTPSDPSTAPTAFTVHVLPAGKGDSLVVEYGASNEAMHRLWIDGGVGSAYEEGAKPFITSRGGAPLAVDVLVCTHIDSDHIGGAIQLLAQNGIVAQDVWFNGLEELMSIRGVKQGDEFSSLIPGEIRNRVTQGRPLAVPDDGPLKVFELADGPVCTLLSPDSGGLDALLALWEKATKRGTEGVGIGDLLGFFGESEAAAPLDRGAVRYGKDRSVPNRSSIALLFEHGGRSALLSGDAHAGVLQRSIERLLENRRTSRLRLDLFKLSHHSSRNNVSAELLELVEVDAFLVCTAGNGDHPDVAGLELARLKFPGATFCFSDDTPTVRRRAKDAGIVQARFPTDGPLTLPFPFRHG